MSGIQAQARKQTLPLEYAILLNLAQEKVGLQGYKGYKDGLQPESLADGKLTGETKSTSVEN